MTLKIIGKCFDFPFVLHVIQLFLHNSILIPLFFADRLRACGGSLSRNLTHLQSPSYPGTYIPDTSVSCAYTFTKVSPSLSTEPMITLTPGQHPSVPSQAGLCGVCDGASHQQHCGESRVCSSILSLALEYS